MSLTERSRAALEHLIKKEFYEENKGAVVVRESEKQGEAEIRCALPSGATCFSWKFKDVKFVFESEKTADAAFLIHGADCRWEAHVMECKRTINPDEWSKAKRQIRSSFARLAAVAGVMGITIERQVCYTAFRKDRDRLSVKRNENPALFKLPLGDTDPTVVDQLDWFGDQLRLNGIPGDIPHVKVTLDPATGEADLHLDLA